MTTLAEPLAAAIPAQTADRFLKSLAYIGFEVADPDRWTRFAHEVLGLEATVGATPDTRFLRMDDRAYRIVLTEGPADDIVFAGWEVADGDTLDAYAAYLPARASRSTGRPPPISRTGRSSGCCACGIRTASSTKPLSARRSAGRSFRRSRAGRS